MFVKGLLNDFVETENQRQTREKERSFFSKSFRKVFLGVLSVRVRQNSFTRKMFLKSIHMTFLFTVLMDCFIGLNLFFLLVFYS